jgi:hypothetical protein
LNEENGEYGVVDETGNLIMNLRGQRGKLFYPYSKDERNEYILKRMGMYAGWDAFLPIFKGNYLTSLDGENLIVYDVNGNSYPMSKYLPLSQVVYPSDDNIFRVENVEKAETGYLKIIPK